MVVEHALVIVHISGIVRVEAVQVFSQLGQIIGTAGFIHSRFILFTSTPVCDVVAHGSHLGIGLAEHLAIAHTAHGIAVTALYHHPKILGEVIVIGVVVPTESSQCSRYHRYVLVGMTCTYGINVAS